MKTIGQQIHGKFNGRSRTLLLAAAAGMALAAPAFAQNRDWLGGSGSWNTATNWNPADVPNTSGETATIAAAGTYTVTMVTGSQLGFYTISNPNVTLDLSGGQELFLFGNCTSNGLVRLNPASINVDSHVRIATNVVLGGSGTFRLMANSNPATGYFVDNGGGQTLFNGSGHIIDGMGAIYCNLNNGGTILADAAGTLLLQGATKTNNTVMQANAGSTLYFNSTTVPQDPAAQIVANGGTVSLCNTFVQGGTLIGQSGGVVNTVCGARIDAATLVGNIQVGAGTELAFGAAITNNGVLNVNPGSVNADTHIRLLSNIGVSGPGAILLSANGNMATAYIADNGGGQTFFQGAGHTIHGTGAIYCNFNNAGLVNADASGAVLQLNGNTKTNNATFRASGGGFLDCVSTTVDQSGGGVLNANGGTVRLSGTLVIGGTISANAGSVVQVNGSSQVRGSTITGAFEILPGMEVAVNNAGFTNNGTLTINPSSINADTHIRALDHLTIGGTGQIILNSNGNLVTAYLADNGGGQITTQAATHTIRGTGRIYSNFVNNGVVNADRNAATLQLTGSTKTNNSLLTATGGGNLDIDACTVNQSGSGAIVANGGSVTIGNSVINGGTLDGVSGWHTTTRANNQFNGVTITGTHDLSGSFEIATATGFTNNGVIIVNPGSINADTHIRALNNLSITGSGQIVLNSNGNLVTAYLADNGGGQLTTQAATHTIRGTGRIYSNFTNNGVVNADRSGATLQVTGSTKTNNNLMTATAGGNLDIDSCTFNQGGSGQVTCNGGTVSIGSSTINGGFLAATNANHAVIRVGSQFNGVTLTGPLDISIATELTTASGFTNNGVITINPSSGNADTHLRVLNNLSIGGSGKIVLNSNGNNVTSYIGDNGGGQVLTNAVGHTIAGNGRLAIRCNNDGIIAPGGGAAQIAAIELTGSALICSPTSVLDFDIVGPGNNVANFDRIVGGTPVTLDGTLRVHTTGYTPGLGETFVIMTTGARTGTFAFVDAKGYRVDYLPNGVRLTAICETDLNEDGNSDQDDVAYLINVIGGGANPNNIDPDFNRDGNADQDDIAALINAIAGGGC